MRLFAALLPSDDAVEHLATTLRNLHDDTLRWADSSSVHITLAFYPDVAENQVAELTERLARAGRRHGPMRLRLASSGRFDDTVLWVGVHGDTTPLRRLASSAAAAAAGRRAGAGGRTTRKFRPHITIARARDNEPDSDLRPYVASLADYEGPTWHALEVALVRSHLGAGPGGRPRHEPLSTFPLIGSSRDHQRLDPGSEG